jgi:uncharacterized repeat protein (TIGR01451 family)
MPSRADLIFRTHGQVDLFLQKIFTSKAVLVKYIKNNIFEKTKPNNMTQKLLTILVALWCFFSVAAKNRSDDPTLVTCTVPNQLTTNNITLTGANLSWGNPGNNVSFEVYVQVAGGFSPTGPVSAAISVSGTSYTVSGLIPGTSYDYWVRAACDTGFTPWSARKNFTTVLGNSLCDVAAQCNYTFRATDQFGDGWTGNVMYVYQNGNVLSTIQMTNGITLDKTIPLCDGMPFELFWAPGGSFANEIGISIINSFGQTIYVKPPGAMQNQTLFAGLVNCNTPAACQIPLSVTMNPISPSSVSLSWSDDTATAWEVYSAPLGSPAPTVSTVGIPTESNPYIFTGLLPNTAYQFYVRGVCGESSVTDWTYPLVFTPVCSTPNNLAITSVATTSATLHWAGNGTQYEVVVLPVGEVPNASTTGTLVSGFQYNVTELTMNQNYRFYVRNICGTNVASAWASSPIFTPILTLPPLVTNTTQYTPSELITNILLDNPCVDVTNITSSTGTNYGSVNGIGYFTNTNPTFPLASGLVLSTGNVNNIPGPNTSSLSDGNPQWLGDPQLETIIAAATGESMSSMNATKLEFDFTSQNASMSFNFLFASEEYGLFQCSFSDAFAFLLTDLESGVTTNLAVVPNTTIPISVVTIRDNEFNTSCNSENAQYFDTLFAQPLQNTSATNFNGQTKKMTAFSSIIPDHPYHIKLVVADRTDSAFDCAVFIEAGSFSAGPPECSDMIRLVAFIDGNGNGIKDDGETDFTYGLFTYQQNNAGDVHNILSPLGYYTIYDSNPANTYDLGFQINPEFLPYYSLTTSYSDINIPIASGMQTFYFPVNLVQGYNDVAVTLVPLQSPRAGAQYTNKIVYRNLGIAPASGTLQFTKDALVSIGSVSQSGVTNTPTGFSYNFSNLLPYETRSIFVTLNVPAIPVVNIDDLLTNTVTISAPSDDIALANNDSALSQIVVAAYDPNNITESHGGKIQFNQFTVNDYLYYTINFQNVGTANAINVRVEDLLDSRFDEQSIRMIGASHDYIMERVGNQLVWHFDYIQLPGAIQNEELSKGYVTYMIKLKPGFSVGTIIQNTASIYFDSNPPIITNTFNTEFVESLGNPEFAAHDVMVYPNPAHGNVTVTLDAANGNLETIALYDMVGKMVKKISGISQTQATLDISMLAKGMYLMEVFTENQLKRTKKLIVQ